MDRRTFLASAVGACWPVQARGDQHALAPPAASVIPVVGDGQWIWKTPPSGQTGYLEPRTFDVSVGLELQGRGSASNLVATTTLPVACPEQTIADEQVRASGCRAELRQVGPYARQLVLRAASIAAGQVIRAVAKSTITISKQYMGYRAEMFPREQKVPADVRRNCLGDSPGIQTRIPEVRKLCEELCAGVDHAWDRAARFAHWTRRNMRPQIGRFTSVERALASRRGDCEEMSAVFVALCRAAEIPARLVWVPNHNWAEFYLEDEQGQGHWIPAHTACYSWFGWTGAHELVLQKGDRLQLPERKGLFRLLEDWMRWMGKRPAVRYLAEMAPRAPAPGADPGPGSRRKIDTGEWQLIGDHPLNRYARR